MLSSETSLKKRKEHSEFSVSIFTHAIIFFKYISFKIYFMYFDNIWNIIATTFFFHEPTWEIFMRYLRCLIRTNNVYIFIALYPNFVQMCISVLINISFVSGDTLDGILLLKINIVRFHHKMRNSVRTRDNGGGWNTLQHVLRYINKKLEN